MDTGRCYVLLCFGMGFSWLWVVVFVEKWQWPWLSFTAGKVDGCSVEQLMPWVVVGPGWCHVTASFKVSREKKGGVF